MCNHPGKAARRKYTESNPHPQKKKRTNMTRFQLRKLDGRSQPKGHELRTTRNCRDLWYNPRQKNHDAVTGPQRSQRSTNRRRLYRQTKTQMKLKQAPRSKAPKVLQIAKRVQVRRTIPRKDKKTFPERHTRYQVKHKSLRRQSRRHLWQESRC